MRSTIQEGIGKAAFLPNDWMTDSMQTSPSNEGRQGLPWFLCNPKGSLPCTQPTTETIPSQMNRIRKSKPDFRTIDYDTYAHIRRWSLPFRLSRHNCIWLFISRACYMSMHLILMISSGPELWKAKWTRPTPQIAGPLWPDVDSRGTNLMVRTRSDDFKYQIWSKSRHNSVRKKPPSYAFTSHT